jgi:hypothetical protein
MTSTVPATYPSLSIGNVLPGKDINAEDWLTISERSNWLYSRQVEIVPGFVELMETGGGPSYTTTNDAASGRDLDTWQAIFIPIRDISKWSLYVYGVHFDFRAAVDTISDTTSSFAGYLNAVEPGAPAGWMVDTATISAPPAPDVFGAIVEFASTDPGLDVALVNEFLITGAVLTTL